MQSSTRKTGTAGEKKGLVLSQKFADPDLSTPICFDLFFVSPKKDWAPAVLIFGYVFKGGASWSSCFAAFGNLSVSLGIGPGAVLAPKSCSPSWELLKRCVPNGDLDPCGTAFWNGKILTLIETDGWTCEGLRLGSSWCCERHGKVVVLSFFLWPKPVNIIFSYSS